MVKNSVVIPNLREYDYRLEVDDIVGIIRLTKNNKKSKTTRITERNIPITTNTKWRFHNQRNGYNSIPNSKYNFIGSYIDRSINKNKYEVWEKFVDTLYKKLRSNNYGNEFNRIDKEINY